VSKTRYGVLEILTAGFYVLWTLLPNSHGLMVSWPSVLLWQIALFCPMLWLLYSSYQGQPILYLGYGLDKGMGILLIGILFNIVFAQHPNPAIWYGIAGLAWGSTFYAFNTWLGINRRSYILVFFQAMLAITFIITSLGTWILQTLLPELSRLQQINTLGLHLSFDFSTLTLRNWHPLGHQNYVAGYLVLSIPLLLGLFITQKKHWRWFWGAGFCLGLIDLYSTSSRGGLLSLGICSILCLALMLLNHRTSRQQLWFSLVGFGLSIGFMLANKRLLNFVSSLGSNLDNSEIAYRIVTCLTGWHMGLAHPWTGVGLGGVSFLYQYYRPAWAGQIADLTFQLHSTLAQLWAEMGFLSLVPFLMGLNILVRGVSLLKPSLSNEVISSKEPLSLPFPIVASLWFALLGYGLYSLTDYQLDNLSISTILALYTVLLISQLKIKEGAFDTEIFAIKPSQLSKRFFIFLLSGFLVLSSLWLIPVDRAWQAASEGFIALQQNNIHLFKTKLTQAVSLAPWKPYYPNQLAWNLGNLAYNNPITPENIALVKESSQWFNHSVQISPYQDFVYLNRGWLLVNQEPEQSTRDFISTIELGYAKKGVFFSLGYSLFQQGLIDLALQAWTLEIMRHPILITSSMWQAENLKPFYTQILAQTETQITQAINRSTTSKQAEYWYLSRARLRWWQGNFVGAQLDWQKNNNPLGQILTDLALGHPIDSQFQALPDSPAKLAIQAWLYPEERQQSLRQALFLQSNLNLTGISSREVEQLIHDLIVTMNISSNIDEWLKQKAPNRNLQNQRLGFGIISRHIDGPIPNDFLPRIENIPMTYFFNSLLDSPVYSPELESILQPLRLNLIQNVKASLASKITPPIQAVK
jgi:uncharacterized protein involved in response to NO